MQKIKQFIAKLLMRLSFAVSGNRFIIHEEYVAIKVVPDKDNEWRKNTITVSYWVKEESKDFARFDEVALYKEGKLEEKYSFSNPA